MTRVRRSSGTRLFAAGVTAFAADFGLLYVLTRFGGIYYLQSAAIAFVLGVLINSWLSRIWVYGGRTVRDAAMQVPVFAAIGLAGLALNETTIWFFHERTHFHYLVAKAISAVIILISNFGARRALSQRRVSRSVLISGGVAAGCLTFCLAIQFFAGAWSADFTTYPDEPSHFVGAVMIHDWLISGQWTTPFTFARHYYDHYPFFAVGYWPPLFHFVTGAWMLLAGVGRLQALVFPALCAAGTGWLIFGLVRSRAGIWPGVCAAALYLSLPEVRTCVCTVMVDHMTAFFCLAAGVCVIRYLRDPQFSNGVLCAICCGCGILSKYNAAYLVLLPFASALLLRRFELFRKPGLLAQPLMVALLVGPWVLWTRKLAFYGLPSETPALTANRIASFVMGTFQMFPPVLLAVVVLGLLAAAARPAAWREDLAVLALLCLGHLAFLVLSPVDAEYRKLLMPAGVVLAMSVIGWWELFALRSPGWRPAAKMFGAVLTVVFAVSQFLHLARMPQGQIRQVVSLIAQRDPAHSSRHIVVPPAGLEGPVIAEFVTQSHDRTGTYLLRPSKLLAHSDWFGLHYSSMFSTPAEMMEYFRQSPVDLIVWNEHAGRPLEMHARIMKDMLRDYPLAWHKVWSSDPGDWAIFQYDTTTSMMAGGYASAIATSH